MKLKTCAFVVYVLLAGCASNVKKINIDNKKFAVGTTALSPIELCQKHKGNTIFGDFDKNHKFNVNLLDVMIDAYKEGLTQLEVEHEVIEMDASFFQNIEYSSWTDVLSLNNQGVETLQKLNDNNIDYLIIPSVLNSIGDESNDCIGPWLRTGKITYVINEIPLIHASGVSVFDTKSGEYIGNGYVNPNLHKVRPPQDPKMITDEEIQYYGKMVSKFAKSSMMEFIRLTK